MNPRHVLLTFGKELREALRDRRTLAIMILLPLVVYPLLAMLAAQVATSREKQREERPSTVAVNGSGPACDALVGQIRKNPALFALAAHGSAGDVESGRLDALVEPDKDDAARLRVVYDASRDESRVAEERLRELLASALPEGCAPVFAMERHSLAPKARLGGYVLSKALPLFVVLMVLLGAFYPAIDVTAGERERGTLETVLCSPIRRFDLMLGKVLAVAALAALTGVVNLGSMAITLLQVLRLAAQNTLLDVPWGNALQSSLVIFPAALLFAATFVALGATARTFKEAQTLLLPVYFLTIAPAMAGAVGEYRLAGLAAWVPGMNVTLLARDLLVGRATWAGGLATIASTVLLAAAALAAAARIYDSERLVGPPPRRQRERAGLPPATSAGDALVLFALAFLLLYFVFLPIEQHSLVVGLLAAQWLGLFGLVLLFARLSGQRFADTIGLGRPAPAAYLGALLIGCSAWAAVALFCEWLLPVPKHLVEELRKTIVPPDGSRGFAVTLLLMALSPAVCEETLFRGPILRGLRTRAGPARAAVITGILFGLFHLDVYRILPATLLGTLLGFVALESGSVLPSMLAHLCNNAILIALAKTGLDQDMESLSHRTLTLILFASVAGTTAGFVLLRKARRNLKM
ncbi:MAG: CPBP family intramembrane metalloprotease [Deltaproteobacteria bacterium]|nr:CPBP family intramembrane metalloprotease [Deltaproteobacteria bacterium]